MAVRKNSGLKGRVKNIVPVNQHKKDVDFVKEMLKNESDDQSIVMQLRSYFNIKAQKGGMEAE